MLLVWVWVWVRAEAEVEVLLLLARVCCWLLLLVWRGVGVPLLWAQECCCLLLLLLLLLLLPNKRGQLRPEVCVVVGGRGG